MHDSELSRDAMNLQRWLGTATAAVVTSVLGAAAPAVAQAPAKKPTILAIWADVRSDRFLVATCQQFGPTSDDIGYWNLSAYNQGMMGYRTRNIDRIAKEGALFTDWYAQQSCAAGLAAIITGHAVSHRHAEGRVAASWAYRASLVCCAHALLTLHLLVNMHAPIYCWLFRWAALPLHRVLFFHRRFSDIPGVDNCGKVYRVAIRPIR